MTRPAIDWARIEELRAEIGEAGMEEILEIFLEDTAELIDGLQRAPVAELSDRVHGIKGSAQSMGFGELVELCRNAEWSLKRGEPVEVARFDECYRRSCTLLLDGVPV